jgi:hypothetical protein
LFDIIRSEICENIMAKRKIVPVKAADKSNIEGISMGLFIEK